MTEKELDNILSGDDDLSITQLAKKFGIPVMSLHSRTAAIKAREARKRVKLKQEKQRLMVVPENGLERPRTCLNCDRQFVSRSVYNRVCSTCKLQW
jgi:hypothetical protein